MNIEFNKAIKDEHGNTVDNITINEDITCGDLIDIGDCTTNNELLIKLASKKSELSYSDIRKLDLTTTLNIINEMQKLLGKDAKKPSTELTSQDSAESQDKA